MRILITGAGNGLGYSLAEYFLSSDSSTSVTALDVDTKNLDSLCSLYLSRCEIIDIDLSDSTLVNNFLSGTDIYDLVILCAGISATGMFERIPISAYERLVSINFRAPIMFASGLSGGGRISRGGKIVFVSSLSHVLGYPGASVYAATKDALTAYARGLSSRLRRENISVLTIFPGPIRTSHAERHAPLDSDASSRISPDDLARLVAGAIRGNRRTYYPGFRTYLFSVFGRLFPSLSTRLMRRLIFLRLPDDPVF